LRLHTNNHEND